MYSECSGDTIQCSGACCCTKFVACSSKSVILMMHKRFLMSCKKNTRGRGEKKSSWDTKRFIHIQKKCKCSWKEGGMAVFLRYKFFPIFLLLHLYSTLHCELLLPIPTLPLLCFAEEYYYIFQRK